MQSEPASFPLASVFDGWAGYQTSLVHAVAPLTPELLNWRPASNERSVGELIGHIALGRIGWFSRMNAPHSQTLAIESTGLELPGGNIHPEFANNLDLLILWLDRTWEMIEGTLQEWTVADLLRTYRHTYWGKTYLVSYQWTIWRILSHDIHHGGQLALMLGMNGVAVPELGDLGGHLTVPPIMEE